MNGKLTIRTTALVPGQTYEVRAKESADALTHTVARTVKLTPATPIAEDTTIVIDGATAPFYELVESTAP